jgi:uncharacterized protein
MIFVDTGALFALTVTDDPRHADVEAWYIKNTAPLITTDYCADELLTLLVARKRPEFAVSTGWKVFNEEIYRLHFLTPDQIRRAGLVFQSKHSFGWSFTDCTSKVLIDEFGIRTAVSLDEHFRQFGSVAIVP